MDDEDRLRALVSGDVELMEILRAVRSVALREWVVGAGVIRNLVWDELHGYDDRTGPNDVDVAFYDPSELSRERDAAIEKRLAALIPEVPWEVTNQAGVHLWYEAKFGAPMDPITSLEDAVARWPETATAVGVRLRSDGRIDVVAPCGLGDLFNGVFRRNPRQVTREYIRKRLAEKRILERWPRVVVVDE